MSEKRDPYEKRYGNYAIELGFVTQEQLLEALNIQVMEEVNGEGHRLTGVILYELGYITLEQDLEILHTLADD